MPDDELRLLTISQAARLLGVHQNTLRSWADKGLVRHVKLPSGYRRFTLDEIQRLRREIGIDTAEGTAPWVEKAHDDEGT
ncbi:MAG: helix-turn-helix domain-containing protein [Actinomycetota bacterium]|nr:helix-turn-helix domain-containing protein [Actinomycetota bacterium]